jgi:glycosyltransferase involved in cell wall biosynthesis
MSRLPRIAVVGHPLAAEENRLAFGGWTRFGVDLVAPREWKARSLGHVYISFGRRHGRTPDEVRDDGDGRPSLHALSIWASGRNSLFLWRGLGPLLDALRPDLVYCWEEPWCLSAWQARRSARRLGVPLVFYTAENRRKRLPWPFAALMRAVFREARACVAPTAEIADTVRSAGFAGPVLTIPLWIRDRRPVRADPEARILAYVGRLIPLKRVHLLVEALPLLPGYRLRVLGDGPDRGRLAGLAASLGVADRVELLGHVDNAVLEDRLEGVSLLVLPTGENARQAEQFGKAALEGVSCGLPVLTSRGGNLARLAEAFPTLAARDLDTPAEMAAAISDRMAAYPDARALAGAREKALARFGAAAVARALEASFAALAGTSAAVPPGVETPA